MTWRGVQRQGGSEGSGKHGRKSIAEENQARNSDVVFSEYDYLKIKHQICKYNINKCIMSLAK